MFAYGFGERGLGGVRLDAYPRLRRFSSGARVMVAFFVCESAFFDR